MRKCVRRSSAWAVLETDVARCVLRFRRSSQTYLLPSRSVCRWRLHRQTDRLGKRYVWLLRRNRKTQRATSVSSTAQALDRRTHFRMAQLVSTPQQGLRTSSHLGGIYDPYRIRAHAPASISLVSGQVLSDSETLLFFIRQAMPFVDREFRESYRYESTGTS